MNYLFLEKRKSLYKKTAKLTGPVKRLKMHADNFSTFYFTVISLVENKIKISHIKLNIFRKFLLCFGNNLHNETRFFFLNANLIKIELNVKELKFLK